MVGPERSGTDAELDGWHIGVNIAHHLSPYSLS